MNILARTAFTVLILLASACGESSTKYKDAGRLSVTDAPAAYDTRSIDAAPEYPIPDSGSGSHDAARLPDLASAMNDAQVDAAVDAPKDAAPDLQDTTPDRPRVNPLPGHYTARLCNPALDGGTDDISPLNSFGFTILMDSAGAYWLRYAADNWAFQNTAVVDGSFFGQKGQGFDGRGGTGCPTDAFLIDGYFTSPISATGRYAAGYRCQITHEGCFIATLDNPPTEPGPEAMDGGTVLDASVD